MIALLRRWRERRRLLRSAAELEYVARRRDEAARAYDAAAKERFGVFARPNVPS